MYFYPYLNLYQFQKKSYYKISPVWALTFPQFALCIIDQCFLLLNLRSDICLGFNFSNLVYVSPRLTFFYVVIFIFVRPNISKKFSYENSEYFSKYYPRIIGHALPAIPNGKARTLLIPKFIGESKFYNIKLLPWS